MRVLILSCNTGEGHNSCGKAIQEAFCDKGIPCEMEDAFRFISPKVSKLISFLFVRVYRHLPGLFRFGYRYSEEHPGVFKRKSGIYKFLTSGAERLHRFIVDEKYDTVICPHVLSALMVTEVLRRHETHLRTYFVATDYTCSPSCGQSELDGYFVPADSLVDDFVNCGIPAEKIIVSGIPIRKGFDLPLNKAEAKKKLGLKPEDRHLLVMCGSMGCGPIKKLMREIARIMPENCRISVVCGTNHRLRKKLENRHAGDVRVEAYSYVRDIPTMMDSADLFLTKPGGISVTEAAKKRLPMVFVNAVAGCETYNMQFYMARNAAVTEETPKQLAEVTVRLLSDEAALCEMKAGFDGLPEESAAEQIVNAIMTAQLTRGA